MRFIKTILEMRNIDITNKKISNEITKYFYKDIEQIINEYLFIPLPIQKINHDIKYLNIVNYFDTCNMLLSATQLNYSYLKQLYFNLIFKGVENDIDKMIDIYEYNYYLIKNDELIIEVSDIINISNENEEDYNEIYNLRRNR